MVSNAKGNEVIEKKVSSAKKKTGEGMDTRYTVIPLS